MKKVLLTGASGSIGYQIIKQLVRNKNTELTVFDRKTSHSKKLFKPYKKQINIIYGDIRNPKDVELAVKGQDYIIHLAAIIPPLADDNPELAESVNVKGTENLLKAIKRYAPNVFFLYSSSVSVYGDRINNCNIKVDDPEKPSPGDEYAVTKLAAEKLIKESKLNWTIFRLSAIMWNNNHKISKLMFHMPLDTFIEITTPEDAARAFVNALNHEKALNRKTFNLGGGENCRTTYRKMLETIFNIVGLKKLNFPPYAFATTNFHYGYYSDGDNLENILHFRKQSLKDLYQAYQNETTTFKKKTTILLSGLIKRKLLKHSEPYLAYREKDKKLMERFFGIYLL